MFCNIRQSRQLQFPDLADIISPTVKDHCHALWMAVRPRCPSALLLFYYIRFFALCTAWRTCMQEFDITFRSFADVQKFVLLASEQPYEVYVENSYQRVDA
jgi:hypothetical protein